MARVHWKDGRSVRRNDRIDLSGLEGKSIYHSARLNGDNGLQSQPRPSVGGRQWRCHQGAQSRIDGQRGVALQSTGRDRVCIHT